MRSQSHQDSQKYQRSIPLTLRNSSKLGRIIISRGGASIGSQRVVGIQSNTEIEIGNWELEESGLDHISNT
jgi:hypothetical protein